MPRTRPAYPAEYKAELVRLVREEGRTPADLAREFEPTGQSIASWVAQAEIDGGAREGLTSDEKAELKRLRAEVRVLRMEKDLLERATAFVGEEPPDPAATMVFDSPLAAWPDFRVSGRFSVAFGRCRC